MPAAAVIPAPIANTNSAAVKKLVVELLVGRIRSLDECPLLLCVSSGHPRQLFWLSSFTVKKLGCFKQKLLGIY